MKILSGVLRLVKPKMELKAEYLDMITEWNQSGEKKVLAVSRKYERRTCRCREPGRKNGDAYGYFKFFIPALEE